MDVFSTEVEKGYSAPEKLEAVWGPGFMSPGGPAEVARIVAGQALTGCHVLDIGSGLGGADVALVRDHGAARVTGAEVQGISVQGAHRRAQALGLDDRIFYVHVRAGDLPFADAVFDVVFSKDALIHVHDKAGIMAEMFRVLRPGGRLVLSDWLRGKDAVHDADAAELNRISGHDFRMGNLEDMAALAAAAGFTAIETEDRNAWYRQEARAEHARLKGDLGRAFAALFGEDALQEELDFYDFLIGMVDRGALRPGHLRAVKP